MFDFLVGKIKNIHKDCVGIDVNGLGFCVHTNKCNELLLEHDYLFYAKDFIKDDEIIIYGFLKQDELKMFEHLISVNSVGFRTACTLLNNLTVEEIIYFIKNKNKEGLASISGVGNRAEHIILELFDKIDDFNKTNIFEYSNVYNALRKIGYRAKDINEAINKLPPSLNDNEALFLTLKEIKKNVY